MKKVSPKSKDIFGGFVLPSVILLGTKSGGTSHYSPVSGLNMKAPRSLFLYIPRSLSRTLPRYVTSTEVEFPSLLEIPAKAYWPWFPSVENIHRYNPKKYVLTY